MALAVLRKLSPLLFASLVVASVARAEATKPEAPAARAKAARADAGRELVAQASVIIVPKACAGSVVQSKLHVLTAAHCIPEGAETVAVKLRTGQVLGSIVEYLDRERDLALLHLDAEAAVEPLMLADYLPAVGSSLLFLGRIDRAKKAQRATVVDIGRCPSLPDMDDAVFTSINALPGDSGAPILDSQRRVVAVIHGGAACHIAAPVYPLSAELAKHSDGEIPGLSPPSAPAPPSTAVPSALPAEGRYSFGPFLFEKTRGGFRFKFSLSTTR